MGLDNLLYILKGIKVKKGICEDCVYLKNNPTEYPCSECENGKLK
jgi:hypothetical protein